MRMIRYVKHGVYYQKPAEEGFLFHGLAGRF